MYDRHDTLFLHRKLSNQALCCSVTGQFCRMFGVETSVLFGEPSVLFGEPSVLFSKPLSHSLKLTDVLELCLHESCPHLWVEYSWNDHAINSPGEN